MHSIPHQRDLISSHVREDGDYPTRRFIAVFVYHNCIREFDGKAWTVRPR